MSNTPPLHHLQQPSHHLVKPPQLRHHANNTSSIAPRPAPGGIIRKTRVQGGLLVNGFGEVFLLTVRERDKQKAAERRKSLSGSHFFSYFPAETVRWTSLSQLSKAAVSRPFGSEVVRRLKSTGNSLGVWNQLCLQEFGFEVSTFNETDKPG